MQSDELKRRISAGRGDALADLVLKNARIVNVFTDEIDTADIAISGNCIVGVGAYHGRKEVDLHGKYVCPGLIDGHIHTEGAESVAAKMQALNDALKAHGVAEDIGIFMTLAFVSLPVIPKLRLNTYGIVDVTQQKIVPAVF